MKQRTQLITLGVLLALLAVVAVISLGGKGRRGGGARAESATPSASPSAAEAAPVEQSAGTPPTAQELDALSAWLVPQSQVEAVLPRVGFGLAAAPKTEGPAVENKQPESALALQGILVVAGQRVALIGGESYRVGQTVANSDFKVKQVGAASVTLQASDGRELVLNLVN